MLMQQIVEEGMTMRGWSLFHGPALATKMYDTAVGPREAAAWFSSSPLDYWLKGEKQHRLSGEYTSEGRNILSTSNEWIGVNATADEIRSQIIAFCDRVDKEIRASYAARLLYPGTIYPIPS